VKLESSAAENEPVTAVPPVIAARLSPPRPAHPVAAIFLYLLAVFVVGALIAPRFHASAQFLAEGNLSLRRLADQPFHRYVNRTLLILAIVGLPIFLRAVGLRSAQALGFVFRARHWAEGAQGFIWGFAGLAMAAALAVSFDARTWDLDHSFSSVLRHIRKTVITASVVAILEELLFRGALFAALRRRYTFWRAALLSSAIYAILHFFEHPQPPYRVEWHTGFVTLAQMLRGFTDWHALVPGFFNLVVVGLTLCLALERTGSLLFSIGLHAGLVFWVKSVGFVTNSVAGANTWAWGTGKLVDGWASCAILLAVLAALYFILPHRKPKPDEPPLA
jgi:membrane protease YdiL (CAAX protease family)